MYNILPVKPFLGNEADEVSVEALYKGTRLWGLRLRLRTKAIDFGSSGPKSSCSKEQLEHKQWVPVRVLPQRRRHLTNINCSLIPIHT